MVIFLEEYPAFDVASGAGVDILTGVSRLRCGLFGWWQSSYRSITPLIQPVTGGDILIEISSLRYTV